MPRINIRSKGAGGEREFCSWLHIKLKLDIVPERNLDQVRNGGADILDVPPFIFEVKRQESLNHRAWWLQVVTASKDTGKIPIVAFRQNRKPWRFLIPAKCIGVPSGFVHLEEREFLMWIKEVYRELPLTYLPIEELVY